MILATLAACAGYGQSVISARSGLIHFSEGEVFLSGKPVEQKLGRFPELREDMELRTDAGRAEVLLTPGIVLRIGADTVINMQSASLIDTRVEFKRGSAVIEVTEDSDGTSARIVYRNYQIRFSKKGSFRLDSLPREFRSYQGAAEVTYLDTQKCTVTKDHKVGLYGGLELEPLSRPLADGLDQWSLRRASELVAANPPPGDLDGAVYDPTFAISPNAFYGLGSFPSPLSSYSYSRYTYPLSYLYGSYGSYGPLPYPVYIYVPGRPVVYSPPVRIPIRPPANGFPRGIFEPVSRHPVAPARPITVHNPVGHPHR
jgi:hypothetical protein